MKRKWSINCPTGRDFNAHTLKFSISWLLTDAPVEPARESRKSAGVAP
ncbi:Uncharacterised protein [Vibrio cholerae]|nr:Uncharacterised protein [Vibrio cholerae]